MVVEDELVRPSRFSIVVEETRFRAEKLIRDRIDTLPVTLREGFCMSIDDDNLYA